MDQSYDKIVQSMFDSLKQMAKLDGDGEDKGQLNYHVILIGEDTFTFLLAIWSGELMRGFGPRKYASFQF